MSHYFNCLNIFLQGAVTIGDVGLQEQEDEFSEDNDENEM